MRALIFLTHAEVVQDPAVPVPQWALNETGRARHARFAQSDMISEVTAVYSSTERKAIEGAAPAATRLGLSPRALEVLGENDRSATGYLKPTEFEAAADAFFAHPDQSFRGWETARAAQARIVAAVRTIAALDTSAGDILIVAHGGVGALLRCHLLDVEIARSGDQPAGGGCYFSTDLGFSARPTDWTRI